MLIVDSQIHIWSSGKPMGPHQHTLSFSKDDALKEMDAAGVNAAVIHPVPWDPNCDAVAIEAARQHPDRFAILSALPLDRPESKALVDTWKDQPGMLGLRYAFLQPRELGWLKDGTAEWIWPAAERAGLPLALLTATDDVPGLVRRVAEHHPGLRLLVDHMGRVSGPKDDAAFANLSDLLALAKFPNVAVKASGAPSYSTQPYPYRNIHKYLQQIFDAFGPQRTFWGTDFTRMPCSYRQCVTMFTEELPWLKGPDQELVMGRALCDWIGWKLTW